MSRNFHAETEKIALRSLCSSAEGRKMWGFLTKDHFATDLGSATFSRIQRTFDKKGELPSWTSVLADPGLNNTHRAALKAFKKPPSKLPKTLSTLKENLEVYRKRRGLNEMIRGISERLESEGMEVDDIMAYGSKAFADIGKAGANLRIHSVGGKTDTAIQLVRAILKGEEKRFIPTGFHTFDSRDYGIPLGTMMVAAGESGSGKSAVVDTLGRNFAIQGARVCLAPLEMDTESMLQRRLAQLTGLSLTKFLNPKSAMSKAEKEKALLEYKRMSLKIKKAGGELTYLEQDTETTLDSILGFAKAHRHDVVIIDYVGLLAGTDGDDQVRALGRIAKRCKLWATHNDAIVILAAQLNDDGLVKYSRALKESASTMWMFQRSLTDKENNIVTILPDKSRQQSPLPFTLYMNLSTMDVRDLTPAELKTVQSLKSASSPSSKGRKKGGSKHFADL